MKPAAHANRAMFSGAKNPIEPFVAALESPGRRWLASIAVNPFQRLLSGWHNAILKDVLSF
jgi:hypothetical protein